MKNIKRVFFVILVLLLLSSVLCIIVFAYSDHDGDYSDDTTYDNTTDDEGTFSLGKNLLIAFAVGLVIALIITGVMRSKMKSVRFQHAAQNYIRPGSMRLVRSSDMYLYSTVTKVPRPQNNNNKK